MKTKIYGASDDLIEIEGAISDEICTFDAKTITCSDGTIAKIKYDGEWKIELKKQGTSYLGIINSVGDESGVVHTAEDAIGCSSYSDVLVLDEDIEWIKIGRKTFNPNPHE